MTRTEVRQETRRMRFAQAYGGGQERRLTQEEAARLPGVCERTVRRSVDRYEDEGLDGLVDKRLGQVSARRAPVEEVVRTETLSRERAPLRGMRLPQDGSTHQWVPAQHRDLIITLDDATSDVDNRR